MVSISRHLSSGQVQSYHIPELTHPRENYYTKQSEITGQWRGKLAEKWGLTNGPVTPEQFERLAEGQDPITGEQLIRHRLESSHTDQNGTTVTTAGHRAGWDVTFSAPKSVSITAVMADGPEKQVVLDAHRQAVDKA